MAVSFILNRRHITLDVDPTEPLLWAIREVKVPVDGAVSGENVNFWKQNFPFADVQECPNDRPSVQCLPRRQDDRNQMPKVACCPVISINEEK